MKRIIFVFLASFFISQFCFSQDIITLKTGETIRSRIIEIGQTEVKYKKFDNQNGPLYVAAKSGILNILYENGTKDIFGGEKEATDAIKVNPLPEKPTETKVITASTANANQDKSKTGTLNIFSELTGIVVFLDENKQGEDIKQVNGVPVGSHYLKVLKDGVSIFGELITISENNVTTVLVKNDGQVEEKILNTKVAEQEEFKNNKLDVILSSGSQTYTKGSSTLFPGYYSYWGFSNSVSTTVGTTDWKIIQGGVKEISERNFASIVENKDLENKIDLQIKKENKTTGIAAAIAVPCVILATCILTDMVGSKPWMHKNNPTHPEWETVAGAISIPVGTIAYLIAMKKPYSGHYTTVDNAAKDAQAYNRKLKQKLGLPENYDISR